MRCLLGLLGVLASHVCGCSYDWARYEDPKSADGSTCATGVPVNRLRRLERGIDLYGWLDAARGPDAFVSDGELAEFRRMGVTFVRASFYAPVLLDPAAPDAIDRANLARFTDAIDRARRAGLGILFVPYFAPEFKQRLGDVASTEVALDALLRMWTAFATALADTDPDWVFLELMGAPDFADDARWNVILWELAKRVRRVVPEHTIVADGNSGSFRVNWTSMTAISHLERVPDERNIVYGFIFFDPVIFTHQGADFRPEWPGLAAVEGLPYPSTPALVEDALERIEDPASRADAANYGRESFGPDLLDMGLAKAAKWSAENCARVLCVEFGAVRTNAPADSVARWVHDVRSSLDAHRIGWSYWSYRERMGIASPPPGPVIDLQIGTALGLQP